MSIYCDPPSRSPGPELAVFAGIFVRREAFSASILKRWLDPGRVIGGPGCMGAAQFDRNVAGASPLRPDHHQAGRYPTPLLEESGTDR